MKQELQNKLFSSYPKIFKQKDLDMTQSCMFWGIETNSGWFKLIDMLCNNLQWDTDNNGEPQIEATQVKEKYGSLVFSTNGFSSRQQGMIDFAEYLSCYICEICGSNKNVKPTQGWITHLCDDCMKNKRR